MYVYRLNRQLSIDTMPRVQDGLTRVALITDNHANLPALEAALTAIGDLDVDAVTVAREVAAAGLPAEYGEKLVLAA